MRREDFFKLYQTYLPSGYETELYRAIAPYIRFPGWVCEEDHFHNVIVYRRGHMGKTAICVATDSGSFTVRYISGDSLRIWLHTEFPTEAEGNTLSGEHLAFPGGRVVKLQKTFDGKYFAEPETLGGFQVGMSGCLEKRIQEYSDRGSLSGIELSGTVGMFALLMLLERQVMFQLDCTLIFSTRNQLRHFPHHGVVHALCNVQPERTIWLGAEKGQLGQIVIDAGEKNSLLPLGLQEAIYRLLRNGVIPEVGALRGILPLLQEATGGPAAGVVIPIHRNTWEEEVRFADIETAVEIAESLIQETDWN